MTETKGLEPRPGSPELKPKIITRPIIGISKKLKGKIFNLNNSETLEITSPGAEGSQKKMVVYGGPGGKIGFDDLSELLEKKCQINFSMGVNVFQEDAGKVRVFDGSESPDKPLPPATPIQDAFILFKKTALEQEKTTGGQPALKEIPLTRDERANRDFLEYVERKQDEEADLLEASVKMPEKAFEKKPDGKLTKLGEAQKAYVSATQAWVKANSFYHQAVSKNEAYSSAEKAAVEAENKYNNAYKASGQKSYEDFRKTELGGRLGKEMDKLWEVAGKARKAFEAVSPGKELAEAIKIAYDNKGNAAENLGQVRPKLPTAQSAESSPLAAKSQMLGIVEPGEGEMRKQFQWDSMVHHFWDRVRETPDESVFGIGRKIRFGIRLDFEELKLWKNAKGNMFPKNPFGEKLTKLEKILLPQKEIQEGFARLVKEHAIEKDGELRTIVLQVVCENLVRKHMDFAQSYYLAKHDPRITADLIEILKLKRDDNTLESYSKILDMLLEGKSRKDVLKDIESSQTEFKTQAEETAWLTALAGKEFQGEGRKAELEAEIAKFRDNLKQLGYKFRKSSDGRLVYIDDENGINISKPDELYLFPEEKGWGYDSLTGANGFLETEIKKGEDGRKAEKEEREAKIQQLISNCGKLEYTFSRSKNFGGRPLIIFLDKSGQNPNFNEFGDLGSTTLDAAIRFLEDELKLSGEEREKQKEAKRANIKAVKDDCTRNAAKLNYSLQQGVNKYGVSGIMVYDKKTGKNVYLDKDGKKSWFLSYADLSKFLKEKIEKTAS